MSYHLKASDSSVQDGVRRVAVSQLESAIAEIDDSDLDRHETIHQVRKRCKKLRGLIRMVRPEFDAYDSENRAFRDAARSLSSLRDAEALIETYDSLMEAFAEEIDRQSFGPIRRQLTERKKAAAAVNGLDDRIAAFREGMVAARGRAKGWHIDAEGFAAVEGGLKKTYKRARKAMAAAEDNPTPDRMHEWRKRAKYHWYHTRLLRGLWPAAMAARRDEADRLGDLLGDHHDLAVFRETLSAEPDAFGDRKALQACLALGERRQEILAAEAFALGRRLFAEKPGALLARWREYWAAWEDHRPLAVRAAAA